MESGNKNNTEALYVFNAAKHKYGMPKLTSMSFSGKDDTYAIQAADFLAYYTRRWMHECVQKDVQVSKPQILKMFSRKLHIVTEGVTDVADLVDGKLPSEEGWELTRR